MSPDASSSPTFGPASRAVVVLDGEVMPPEARIFGSEQGQPASAAEPSRSRGRVLGIMIGVGIAVTIVGGIGAFEGARWIRRSHETVTGTRATAAAVTRLGEDIDDVKTALAAKPESSAIGELRSSVAQLTAQLAAVRAAQEAQVADLTAKLAARESVPAPPTVIDIASRLDRLDRDPRLADMTARLDRVERQVSAPLVTGSIAPVDRKTAGQTVVAQNDQADRSLRPPVLSDWVVRDVYAGIALVEGRSGTVREVVPGEVLPGAGQVRSIQRRGRGWILVTSRGIINTATW